MWYVAKFRWLLPASRSLFLKLCHRGFYKAITQGENGMIDKNRLKRSLIPLTSLQQSLKSYLTTRNQFLDTFLIYRRQYQRVSVSVWNSASKISPWQHGYPSVLFNETGFLHPRENQKWHLVPCEIQLSSHLTSHPPIKCHGHLGKDTDQRSLIGCGSELSERAGCTLPCPNVSPFQPSRCPPGSCFAPISLMLFTSPAVV